MFKVWKTTILLAPHYLVAKSHEKMSTPVLNPFLKHIPCPADDVCSSAQIQSSIRQAISMSPLAPKTSYDVATLDDACNLADGFFMLCSDLPHANLQLNVAVASYVIPKATPQKIVFTLSFTLAPRHSAIQTMWSFIVRDRWILDNFDAIEMRVPNRPLVG